MKFLLSFTSTLAVIFALNRSWVIDGNRIPPLGKFLDPIHGFWQNAEPMDMKIPDERALNGLHGAVTLMYDSLLIPHIFALSEEDLYLTQGYVTAMHRLWQMEFLTHATAGRLASILGPGPDSVLLHRDRLQRRLGLVMAAQHALDASMADPYAKMMIEKYTEGINQYIHSLEYKDLPLEYKLLDYYPEDWTPLKCSILLKSMAQVLNMRDKDIQMSNALHLFGADTVALLYPDHEMAEAPIIEKPDGWNFPSLSLDSIPLALPNELIGILNLPEDKPGIGSNNWAVSGAKTATGSPILCSDPHLDTSLPSLWFATQLHAPGLNVMGVSLPGLPTVVIGFNDSIAWGITNAQRDLVDWYEITYKDSHRNQYLLDSQWVDTRKEIEAIAIRGGDIFYDTVVYTQWGPIPYDHNFNAPPGRQGAQDYAFRWISHDASNEMLSFYRLNRAHNYDDFVKALSLFQSPAQNFAFASQSGDIAMLVQGKFPIRRKYEGKFVLDGSHASNGWQAFVPEDQQIRDKNPERGFVSSANQYPTDASYPYYIQGTSYEVYRNRRINQVLAANDSLTIQDMMALQNDNYSLMAHESLPYFLEMLDSLPLSKEESHVYNLLKKWDYKYNADSEAATCYQVWWTHIYHLTWDELHRDDAELSLPTAHHTLELIKEIPTLRFFDIQTTPLPETATDVVRMAFQQAVDSLTQWQAKHHQPPLWADYKDTYIQHLSRLAPFSGHVRHGGVGGAVNASNRLHGPSWRMIVSLEKDHTKAYGVYPGGQSGNPGSAFYSNMVTPWSQGEYFKLHYIKDPADTTFNPLFRTTLTPPIP